MGKDRGVPSRLKADETWKYSVLQHKELNSSNSGRAFPSRISGDTAALAESETEILWRTKQRAQLSRSPIPGPKK